MLLRTVRNQTLVRIVVMALIAAIGSIESIAAQSIPFGVGGRVEAVALLDIEDLSGYAELTLDPSTAGGDILHVRVSSVSLDVALLLPTGQLFTKANAVSFGYEWETIDILPGNETSGFGLLSPGRHEIIRFPPAQPAGSYQIQASRSSAGDPVAVSASFHSRSGIRFGVNVPSRGNLPNHPVTVVGILLAEEDPVSGASVSGTVHVLVEQPSGVALTNWQLQQKMDVGDGRSHYVYSAALQNTSSPFQQFRAEARQPDETITLDHSEMWFRDVAQGETKPCSLCFGFTGPTSPEPSPASFPWRILGGPKGTA